MSGKRRRAEPRAREKSGRWQAREKGVRWQVRENGDRRQLWETAAGGKRGKQWPMASAGKAGQALDDCFGFHSCLAEMISVEEQTANTILLKVAWRSVVNCVSQWTFLQY